jgi:acetyl esterase/lipase
MRKCCVVILAGCFATVSLPNASAAPALLRAVHSLDEPRGYCLDIPGAGATLNLDAPLQAHTCKEQASVDDQVFEMAAEQIRSHERCLTAEKLEAGSALVLRNCSDSRQQRWRFLDGSLSPTGRRELCVALAAVRGEPWGTPRLITPVYRRQPLALATCDQRDTARQAFQWLPREEAATEPSTADRQRGGMPLEVATALAAFGHEFDGAIAQQTAAIYAAQPHVYAPAELTVMKELAYGPHERQHLDVHTRANRPAEPVPVIVVFHGGGLIGGSRAATVNVAEYFASLGYVGVNGGYRLAPDAKWPEGARDIGAAVTWLRDHVAEYGGDPAQIFVAGISTGALHAATYVFRPELAPNAARPAGAILVSGPYTFDFAAAGRGELAYFGEDRSRWPEMVVPGNVTSAAVPVLMTTAEWDNARYTTSYAQLFHELVTKHGVVPRYLQSLGHNHSSQLLSVGTHDDSVSSVIVDFIERTGGR